MFFDTHAHYDSSAFDGDRDAVLASLASQGVDTVIDPGCDEASSRCAVALAERWPFVYAAVGWQPEEWESWDERSAAVVRALAAHPKAVAIGEIGLDYYWDKEHKAIQHEMFRAQLAIAGELDKPVIVHDREAHGDCLDITAEFPKVRGTFHCFSGSAEMAELLLRRGWYLGFDGPITFKNNKKAAEVLSVCPMDRILIETDSPYLTPEPKRGARNDSGNLRYIAEKIAAVKGVPMETVAAASSENARRLFNL